MKNTSPSDTASRLQRAGLTGVATLVARGVTWTVSLLSLPLASHYLGRERFGLWLTLIGVVNWFSIADLGITNSLVNRLTTVLTQGDQSAAQRLVSSALGVSVAVATLFLIVMGCGIVFFDPSRFFKLQEVSAQREIKGALLVIAGCFALRLLAGVTASIFLALQEGYLYQLWCIASGLLSASGLWLAIRSHAGLAGLIGGFVGGWLVGELLAAGHLFGWHRKDLRPHWRNFERPAARDLLTSGFSFWLAQMSAVILLQTDLFIVAGLFGAQAVAEYGTAMRLFNLVGAAQTAFVAPLWVAYGEAFARRDYRWLAQTFRYSLWLSAAFVLPASLFIFAAAPWLFGWLVTADLRATRSLLLALLVVEIANAAARCIAMLLNGIGLVRPQAVYGPIAAIANLVLSVILARYMGSAGVAWATALCLAAFWLLLLGGIARRQLRLWQTSAEAA